MHWIERKTWLTPNNPRVPFGSCIEIRTNLHKPMPVPAAGSVESVETQSRLVEKRVNRVVLFIQFNSTTYAWSN